MFGRELDERLLFEIENALEDLDLPYLVDASLHSQIDNESLRQHIQRLGRVIYPAGPLET